MPSMIGIDNAIASGHMQLRGGWKNLLITMGGYALLMVVLLIVTIRMSSPRGMGVVFSGWTRGLLALQGAFLIMLGAATIGGGLRLDLTSRMIESHRLMPISPPMAVAGYLLGTTCQVLAMASITFILGAITCMASGLPLMNWAIANALLIIFALFVWLGVLFAGFLSKNSFRWVTALGVGLAISRGTLIGVLPALAVLLSPLRGVSIFSMRTSSIDYGYGMAILAQLFFGGVFFIAASRRYCRDDVPALGTLLGLLLLAGWIGFSGLGIRQWDEFEPRYMPGISQGPRVQYICSLAVGLLLAIIPVASSAWSSDELRRRRRQAGYGSGPSILLPPELIVLACVGVLLLLSAASPQTHLDISQLRLRTALVAGAFLLSTSYLFRMMYRVRVRPLLVVGGWVVLSWIGPFLIDVLRYSMQEKEDNSTTWIFTCSPIGALIDLHDRVPAPTTLGIAIQLGIAALLAALYYMPRRSGSGVGSRV